MLRKSLLTLALAATGINSAFALSTGDIAFTAFNADEDGWSLATFVDISANSTLYFTDNEWNGGVIGAGGAFNTGESYHQWNSGGSTIAAGSVIRFSAVDHADNLAASVGTLMRATVSGSSNWGISASGETIYAFLGSSASAPITFLTAISSEGFTGGQLGNTGLTAGSNAVQINSGTDFAEYTGSRAGELNFAAYLPMVANNSNWNNLGDGSFATLLPNTTAFTVAPVPVPAALPLLLSGIAALGVIGRRRGNDLFRSADQS